MIRRDFFKAVGAALVCGKLPIKQEIIKLANGNRIFCVGCRHGLGMIGFNTHLQNIVVSAKLIRTQIPELGRKGPYFKYAQFPVEITTPISLIECE